MTVVPMPGGRLLRHRIQKLVPRDENISIPEVNMLKNSSTLAVSVPINVSIKLTSVPVNGTRKLKLWTRLATTKVALSPIIY